MVLFFSFLVAKWQHGFGEFQMVLSFEVSGPKTPFGLKPVGYRWDGDDSLVLFDPNIQLSFSNVKRLGVFRVPGPTVRY